MQITTHTFSESRHPKLSKKTIPKKFHSRNVAQKVSYIRPSSQKVCVCAFVNYSMVNYTGEWSDIWLRSTGKVSLHKRTMMGVCMAVLIASAHDTGRSKDVSRCARIRCMSHTEPDKDPSSPLSPFYHNTTHQLHLSPPIHLFISVHLLVHNVSRHTGWRREQLIPSLRVRCSNSMKRDSLFISHKILRKEGLALCHKGKGVTYIK